MPGFSKTLRERFKSKWAEKQVGAGARSQKKTETPADLATRRIPVIEKPPKKLKKRSTKRKKERH